MQVGFKELDALLDKGLAYPSVMEVLGSSSSGKTEFLLNVQLQIVLLVIVVGCTGMLTGCQSSCRYAVREFCRKCTMGFWWVVTKPLLSSSAWEALLLTMSRGWCPSWIYMPDMFENRYSSSVAAFGHQDYWFVSTWSDRVVALPIAN